MNFFKFDLNLFKVFVKVMETGSYVQASEALDVSPPAVSLAMRRLQKSLGVDLFIRGNSKVRPTSAALALYTNVRDELLAFEQVVNSFDTFNPQTSTKRFFISTPEEFHTQLLREPPSKENEKITYSLHEQIYDEERGITDLRNRKIDLIVDNCLLEDKSLAHELLFEDDIVLVVANSHSHSEVGISLDDYQKLPQSVLSLRRNNKLALDLFFEKPVNIKRHIVNEASSMLANMLVVSETQLFCHTTRSLAMYYKQTLGLTIIEPPIPLKRIPFYMQWHKSNSSSSTHQWLRERVKSLIKK
ncbi:LysR family transcriptional regulator [Photobacterium makurazakiensis]|uniref:LysR family transcriptional regulator n=1 Tax=Photobacterium makurazakiensis TaxID=2910234 RepID=UPI003D141C0D